MPLMMIGQQEIFLMVISSSHKAYKLKKELPQKNFFTQSTNEDEETKIDFQSLSLYTLSSLCKTSSLLRQPLFIYH
jgi:hypothetical protein